MIFQQFFDEETWTYTYLLGDETACEAVIIDPVNTHLEFYLRLLQKKELRLKYSLETHVHADHITAGGLLRQRAGAETAVSELCGAECADIQIQDGEVFRFGDYEQIIVIATPGHTPGSVSFLWQDRLITGDSLFINGCGRTDFQGGDPGALYDCITQKLFALPDDTLVYPGHDYNGHRVSNIAQERSTNSRLADRSREEFIDIMNGLGLPAPKLIEQSVPANRSCGLPDGERHDAITRSSNTQTGEYRQDTVSAAVGVTTQSLVNQAKANIIEIDVTTAKQRVSAGNYVILDVREPSEYEAGALPAAVNVPRGTLEFKLPTTGEFADKSASILVYCRTGGRAALAARSMQQLGYSNVQSLAGGYEAWTKE